MQQSRPNPLWLVALVGFGLLAYGGYKWVGVERLSEQELEASIEANFQVDLARRRAQSPDGSAHLGEEWERKHRQAIRQELESSIQQDKDFAKSWMLGGLGLLVISFGRLFAVPLARKYSQ